MAKAGSKAEKPSPGDRDLTRNRKASHDYELGQRYEAGLVLLGSEARSLRDNAPGLADSWVELDRAGEAWVRHLRIPVLPHAAFGHEELRPRKLLLHAHELAQLRAAVEREGMTLVPTRLYYKKGRAKLELAVAEGRKKHDKRHAIAERDAEREARAAIQRARKG